ncbi:MAG: tRNA adenosine(34) deaminase TadA [Acidobacteriota bacterium]
MPEDDLEWMHEAMRAAAKAGDAGEVPIGACVVSADGELLASAFNLTITNNDPTAHAEILAIRAASILVGNYRLTGATVYSTLEPCVMCAGALLNARVARLVFGAHDERFGAVETHFRICDTEVLNHRIDVTSGILATESRTLLQDFFRSRRIEIKAARQDKG